MKVYKFGGASVKNALAIKNVAKILKENSNDKIVVVISAMAKTTNALEKVWESMSASENVFRESLDEVKLFHESVLLELNLQDDLLIGGELNRIYESIVKVCQQDNQSNMDYVYDQLVSNGELISTLIISRYLELNGVHNKWVDARTLIKTDYNYREAKVEWLRTGSNVQSLLLPYFNVSENKLVITQGFIGGADSLNTTTLGREGSDYTAAILAYTLEADEVVIWKDVPGVLNADPKYFPDAVKLDSISYTEAIELAYYGASVIHPKTVQPLQNKKIPLKVQSFINPEANGTVISESAEYDHVVPSYIFKRNQKLISIETKDFAFIAEENLREIFDLFSRHKVKMNIMQNSAIKFSIAIDNGDNRSVDLIEELRSHYNVLYNDGLTLVTIRHYDKETVDKLTKGHQVLLEQRTRSTFRALLKSFDEEAF